MLTAVALYCLPVRAERVSLEAFAGHPENIPIAVTLFEPEWGSVMVETAPDNIIADDLAFCGRFAVTRSVRNDSALFARQMIWIAIEGGYTAPRDSIHIGCVIVATLDREVLHTAVLSGSLRDYRAICHRYSDMVYELLFQEKGMFRTRILFVRGRGLDSELWAMDYDGHGMSQVTATRSQALFPCFAGPERFLFISYARGKPDLFAGAFGSQATVAVAATRATESSPAWSDVEERVLFASSFTGNLELYTCNRDGSARRQLTFNQTVDTSPCFSPDGSHVAYISDRSGSPQLYVMDSDGTNNRRLTFEGGYQDSPAWSPRGDRIAFTSLRDGRFDIWTIQTDGRQLSRVTGTRDKNEYCAWVPTGTHIVFQSTLNGRTDLFAVQPDGGGLVQLTMCGDAKMPDWGPFPREPLFSENNRSPDDAP